MFGGTGGVLSGPPKCLCAALASDVATEIASTRLTAHFKLSIKIGLTTRGVLFF